MPEDARSDLEPVCNVAILLARAYLRLAQASNSHHSATGAAERPVSGASGVAIASVAQNKLLLIRPTEQI